MKLNQRGCHAEISRNIHAHATHFSVKKSWGFKLSFVLQLRAHTKVEACIYVYVCVSHVCMCMYVCVQTGSSRPTCESGQEWRSLKRTMITISSVPFIFLLFFFSIILKMSRRQVKRLEEQVWEHVCVPVSFFVCFSVLLLGVCVFGCANVSVCGFYTEKHARRGKTDYFCMHIGKVCACKNLQPMSAMHDIPAGG